MRNFLTIMLICGVIWPSIAGHKILFFKSCPNVTPMNSFDVDRFLGKWYIIEVFTATKYVNKCMTMTFERLTDTDFQVTQSREFALLGRVNVDYRHQYTGTLKMTNPDRPSEMKIKWPSHIVGSATFRVVDTDYDKYALINDCQNLFVVSRLSFAILARERTLDQETVDRLRQQIREEGINTSPLNVVDQFSCGGGSGSGTGTGTRNGTGTGTRNDAGTGTGNGTGTGTGTRNETGTGTGTGTRNETGTGTGNGTRTGTRNETGTGNGTRTGTRNETGTGSEGEGGEEIPNIESFTEPIEANLLALIDEKEFAKIKDTYQLAEHLNWQVTKEDLHDENLPHPNKKEKNNKNNKNNNNNNKKQ